MVSALRLPDNKLDFSEQVLLTALSASFVLVCLSNLLELRLHTLLGQPIWGKDEKGKLRVPLGFLMALSNRLLIMAVILLLSLLSYPWTYACVAVNFLYGAAYLRVHFVVEPPWDYPNAPP